MHEYKQPGRYKISITAYNLVGPNITVFGEVLASFPVITNISTIISLSRAPSLSGSKYYICVGDEIKMAATPLVEGYSKCLYNFNDTQEFISSQKYVYKRPGIFTPKVICKNNISSLVMSTDVIIVAQNPDPIKGMSIRSQNVPFGSYVQFYLTLSSGKCFICKWTFGDGSEMITDFSHLGSTVNHSYDTTGEYDVSVYCRNINNSAFSRLVSKVHIPIEGLQIKSLNGYISTHFNTSFNVSIEKGSYVNLIINFNDGNTKRTKLILNKEHTFVHSFKLPGKYRISVTAFNAISRKHVLLHNNISVQHPLKRLSLSSNSPIRLIHGIAIFQIRKEISAAVPTNCTCKWKFGDGCESTTPLIFDNNLMFNFSHHYLLPKNYITTVICSNLVSYSNLSEEVYVHRIVHPNITAAYEESGILCKSSANFSSECYFPLGAPISFSITSQVLDQTYVWSIQNSSSNWTVSTRKPSFKQTFSTTGVFYLHSSVQNTLAILSCHLTIIIQQQIVFNGFTTDNQVLLRNPVALQVSFKAIGTDSCHVLKLGDGNQVIFGKAQCMDITSENLQQPTKYLLGINSLNITHYYTNEGDYAVSLYGYNKVSSIKSGIVIKVRKPPCRILNMTLTMNNTKHVNSGDIFNFTRATSFMFNSNFSFDCSLADSVRARWLIRNNNTTRVISTSTVLVLAYSMTYGTYELIIDVGPMGKDIVELYNNTNLMKSIYVNIVPSQLIAFIDGGSTRTVGYPSILLLDASRSYDPDVEPSQQDNELTFHWFCWFNVSGTITGCFSPDLRKSFSNKTTKAIQTATLKYDRVYNFELVICKHDREASFKQSVILEVDAPPHMEIRFVNSLNLVWESNLHMFT